MSDVEIRKQTGNPVRLQDAFRTIVSAGGSIDKEWQIERVLSVGDEDTQTHVLERMYASWSATPVGVDLPELWLQLGIREGPQGVVFNDLAPLAAIRAAITAAPRNVPAAK